MAECKGCPNLEMRVEGKGFFKSGEYKCYCRARNNAPLSNDTVRRVCVDYSPDALMDQINRVKNQSFLGRGEPCWKRCQYAKFYWG